MTENNESTTMEDQHVVIDLAVDSVELLSTRPSIGAARAEYIVRLRDILRASRKPSTRT